MHDGAVATNKYLHYGQEIHLICLQYFQDANSIISALKSIFAPKITMCKK